MKLKFRQFVRETNTSGDKTNRVIHYWGELEEGAFIAPMNHSEYPSEQFTGMQDMDGTDIYVGDILNWEAQESQPANSVVKLVEGGFVFQDLWEGKESGGVGSLWQNREVIKEAHRIVGHI